MKKSITITARITPALDRKITMFAKLAKRTKSQAIQIVLSEHIDYEIGFVEAVLEGIRSAEEEGTIPHEEVMRQLKAKSARFRRAMRKNAA
jgi:predicted transcriptional regulator